jgi:hypothetical protein
VMTGGTGGDPLLEIIIDCSCSGVSGCSGAGNLRSDELDGLADSSLLEVSAGIGSIGENDAGPLIGIGRSCRSEMFQIVRILKTAHPWIL